MYNQIKSKNSIDMAEEFTSNFINTLIIFCLFILVVFYIFAYDFVKIFAVGFDGATLDLAVKFTRICLVGVIFSILINVFGSYLNIKDNFHVPAMMGIPNNIILISSIFISRYLGTVILPLGILISLIVQTVILVIFAHKKGFKYNLKIDVRDDNIKEMVALSLPIIIGLSVNQINILVDRTIASSVAAGGISSLSYANRVIQVIQGVFIAAITTVMYPRISKLAAEENMVRFKDTVLKTINGVVIFVFPAVMGAVLFSRPIINLLYFRGSFNEVALDMTVSAFLFYSLGIVGFGLRDVLVRVFYSIKETKAPIINASIGMVLNIALNIILSRYLGIGGLALATSISAAVTVVLLFISLRRIIDFSIGKSKLVYLKIMASTAIMGIVGRTIYSFIQNVINDSLALILAMVVCLVLYGMSIYLFKVEEAREFIKVIKTQAFANKEGR